jgi:hypothetical protein
MTPANRDRLILCIAVALTSAIPSFMAGMAVRKPFNASTGDSSKQWQPQPDGLAAKERWLNLDVQALTFDAEQMAIQALQAEINHPDYVGGRVTAVRRVKEWIEYEQAALKDKPQMELWRGPES